MSFRSLSIHAARAAIALSIVASALIGTATPANAAVNKTERLTIPVGTKTCVFDITYGWAFRAYATAQVLPSLSTAADCEITPSVSDSGLLLNYGLQSSYYTRFDGLRITDRAIKQMAVGSTERPYAGSSFRISTKDVFYGTRTSQNMICSDFCEPPWSSVPKQNTVITHVLTFGTKTCTFQVMHGQFGFTAYAQVSVAPGFSNTTCTGFVRVQAMPGTPGIAPAAITSTATWAQSSIPGVFWYAIYTFTVTDASGNLLKMIV